LLSFAQYQFGKGVTGKHYREKEDEKCTSNWIVDIEISKITIHRLANLHGQDRLLSTIVKDDIDFPYLEQSLSLLNLWMINLTDKRFTEKVVLYGVQHGSYNYA
jgi:hypothetical protein